MLSAHNHVSLGAWELADRHELKSRLGQRLGGKHVTSLCARLLEGALPESAEGERRRVIRHDESAAERAFRYNRSQRDGEMAEWLKAAVC